MAIKYRYYRHDGIIEPFAGSGSLPYPEVSQEEFINWAKGTPGRDSSLPGFTGSMYEVYQRILPEAITGQSNIVASYTNPLTGEILRDISQSEIDKIEAQKAGIANGTLRDLGNGQTVPIGSAADQIRDQMGTNNTASLGVTAGQGGQVYRDEQDNFYLDGRKIELDEFQSLGINADFVQRGQTVSLGQAVGGLASGGVSGGTPGGSIPTIDISSLPPEQQALYTRLEEYLSKLEAQGLAINPNVQITPDKLAEFTIQAKNEIEPYYANQLKVAKDQLLTSFGYSQQQILDQEKQLEKQFKQQYQQVGEQSAEQGFAQSGRRVLNEQNLQSDTQNVIDENRRKLGFQATNAASSFAQNFGTSNLPQLNLQGAPRVLDTGFQQGADSPFYSLTPSVYDGLKGSQEFEKEASVRNRASQLEESYRSGLANTQLRQLTL